MKCETDVVLLDGWERVYEVSMIAPLEPVSAPHPPGKLRGFPTLNLAQWNSNAATLRTQRIPLPWQGAQLVIKNSRGKKRCEYAVETRIVRGKEVVPLLERTYDRDCG